MGRNPIKGSLLSKLFGRFICSDNKPKVNIDIDILHELRDRVFKYYAGSIEFVPKHYTADILQGISDVIDIIDKFIDEKERINRL